MTTLLLATTTTMTLTSGQFLFFQIMVYIGSAAIVGFVLYSIAWLIEKLTERKLYDEQQIDLIVQRAKLDTIRQLQDKLIIDDEQLEDKIRSVIQKKNNEQEKR